MKLPRALDQLLNKKSDTRKEAFISLIVHTGYVQVGVWVSGSGGKLHSIGSGKKELKEATWEERTSSADELLAAIEEAHPDYILQKVILALPQEFLTETGDIEKETRLHIKKLTNNLTLTPVGFVPLDQAIIHKLKLDEGVPPNVILLDVTSNDIIVRIYKVGMLSASTRVALGDTLTAELETAFKEMKHIEVLPSRMLLYGGKKDQLDAVKNLLLHHPWQTRVNFLHYPKIEVLPDDVIITSVSLAGASELSASIGESVSEQEVSPEETAAPEIIAEAVPTHTSVSQPSEVVNETFEQPKQVDDQISNLPVESDVIAVDPASLGFSKREPVAADISTNETGKSPFVSQIKNRMAGLKIPHIALPHLPGGGNPKIALIALIAVVFVGITALGFWFVPRATVTVLAAPQTLGASDALLVSAEAGSVDVENKTIPGTLQEKIMSGEKTAPVTGKKQVGDPAKGTVTIYNKSTSGRSLKKGSVLQAGSLKFTLDDDVLVASASESIGSITFGKTNVNISASAIGQQSNLPAQTEFTFNDVSASVLIARNDQALAGGTSKNVTVVTRADYDALTKSLTDELLEKAKGELSASLPPEEKLIEETVTTKVTDRQFTAELDEEVTEITGTITLAVTGMTFREEDVKSLLRDKAQGQVLAGYTFADAQSTVQVENPEVNDDGTINVAGELTGLALPQIDVADIRKKLGGKSVAQASELLKTIPGIGGVMFDIRLSLWKDRLPFNTGNIGITIQVQE